MALRNAKKKIRVANATGKSLRSAKQHATRRSAKQLRGRTRREPAPVTLHDPHTHHFGVGVTDPDHFDPTV